MNPKLIAGVVVALVLVGAGAAFVTGFGPAPGGADASGSDIEEFPTQTPSDAAGGATTGTAVADGTATPPPDSPAFQFTIDRVEECGDTCRDVTSTLRNNGTAPATGVVVYTRVFVGNDTDGDVVWQGKEEVGRLDANATYTATRRVELSYSEGLAVQRADGWITIQTTVETADQTVTFSERRQVS